MLLLYPLPARYIRLILRLHKSRRYHIATLQCRILVLSGISLVHGQNGIVVGLRLVVLVGHAGWGHLHRTVTFRIEVAVLATACEDAE